MTFKLSYVSAFLSLLVIGCASKSKDGASSQAGVPAPLAQRLQESGGFKQDEKGNWVPKSDKRSAFELQRETPHFKGKVEKKAYQTGDFEKKSWWGKKTYKVDSYKGDTDGSRFKTQAKPHGKAAPYGAEKVDIGDPYRTNTLDYREARESNSDRITKSRNDYTESRKRRYVQPEVIDWEEQRKLSLEQSRSILGR